MVKVVVPPQFWDGMECHEQGEGIPMIHWAWGMGEMKTAMVAMSKWDEPR